MPAFNKSLIEVVPAGKRTYLWVGREDGSVSGLIYGVVSGPARLRRFAQAILDEVGEA